MAKLDLGSEKTETARELGKLKCDGSHREAVVQPNGWNASAVEEA